jgi:Ca2+-binding EF-hand superfamily protein
MKNQNLIRNGAVALVLLVASASATLADPKTEKAFARMDADDSGGISSEEFVQARTNWAMKQGEKKGLSEAEIEERVAKSQKWAPKGFEKADLDGDGELSMEEFAEMRAKQQKKK